MKITKEQNAITLIALVITIIVLLILAGVALATLNGNTSIIDNANYAVEEYSRTSNADDAIINKVEGMFAKYMGESSNAGDDDDDDTPPAQKTVADLQEGDWVLYDTGVPSVGDNGIISCRVLYNDAEHGIQLISKGTVGPDITLIVSDFETSKTNYINAISILNTAAGTYKNLTYAYDARSVGSVPTEVNGMFNAKNSEVAGPVTLPFEYNGSNEMDVPNTDTNYETDWTQMENLGGNNVNIQDIGECYWLASRWGIHENPNNPDTCPFALRCGGTDGTVGGSGVVGFPTAFGVTNSSIGFGSSGPNYKLRPCFSLKPNIKVITEGGKDGTTEEKAYTLAP